MASLDEITIYSIMAVSLYMIIFYIRTFLENQEKSESPKIKKFPKVSIVLPVYNEGEIIEKVLQSVINLDYPKKEIIFVNDGSTDDTLKKAKKFRKHGVKIFSKKNEGNKAAAVNFGLKKCTADFVFILDADSIPERDALKKMMGHFKDPKVMAVVPSLRPWKPKNFLERLQIVEYTLSSLIKKVMSMVGALNTTPGAPVIRKSFIDKHGGYEVGNMTEDFEYGLRIQSHNYQVASAYDAIVYTVVPSTLKELYKQRVRWNYGGLFNLKKYSNLLSWKYGDLGIVIIPSTLIILGLIPLFFIYSFGRVIYEILNAITLVSLINFKIFDLKMNIDLYEILFALTDLKVLLVIAAIILSIIIYNISRKQLKEKMGLMYFAYVFFYGWFLNFVTIASLCYFLTKKKPSW